MSVLLIRDERSVRTITLNRPEKRNALTPELQDLLVEAMEGAQEAGARVVILRGEGPNFCAGLDLSVLRDMDRSTDEGPDSEAARTARMFRALYECPLPTIAAVRGAAVAGGAGLAAICDFTLATPESRFGYPEARIGFVPALVSAYLVQQVGDKIARGLLLSGRLVDAATAQALGLVSEVVAAETLEARALEIAAELMLSSPASLRATKELLREQQAPQLDRALELALAANAATQKTDDFREGVASFLEKRKPAWHVR